MKFKKKILAAVEMDFKSVKNDLLRLKGIC